LPVLLLALEKADIARSIIAGDFAPFDRPAYMNANLQGQKSKPSSDLIRAAINTAPENILEKAFTNGLPESAHFKIDREFRDDMRSGWGHGDMTTMDAFYYYYLHFTRDENHSEENVETLKTPVKVIWGELDFFIKKDWAWSWPIGSVRSSGFFLASDIIRTFSLPGRLPRKFDLRLLNNKVAQYACTALVAPRPARSSAIADTAAL
jgi:hypothetical protein